MDEVDTFVSPVRLASSRRGAPVTPALMGEEKHDRPVTIIWFDHGMTTGWGVLNLWPEALTSPRYKILSNIHSWSAGEYVGSEADITDQSMDLIEAWGDRARIGWEDFILRTFSMGRELLAPVRLMSRLEDRLYIAGRSGQIVPPQQAALAMAKVTDARLKSWGFWAPLRSAHARDAMRHLITYAARTKAAWLAEDEG